MPAIEPITLFHAPQSRSAGARTLLEELGADYELYVINMKAGEQRQPKFLAINPLGKVPAIRHRGMLVTEQVAIFIYLADLFPDAGLAPALDDPSRGPYLRWLVYYAACMEPCIVDRAMKREPAPLAMSPYGDFDVVIATLEEQLRQGPYLLGEGLSAADILWGNALKWIIGFGLVPDTDVFHAYVERIAGRPAATKVTEEDVQLAAVHAQEAAEKTHA
jgi:glutathione S-transferase